MRRRTAALARAGVALVVLGLLAGCSGSPGADSPSGGSSPQASDAALASAALQVPSSLRSAPFDAEHTVLAPRGWHVSLWARVDKARLAAWTPDGRLLVSRPEYGDVQVLTPRTDPAAPPTVGTLVSGLRQPHGLAFDGGTLFIAESDRVDAYRYTDGRATERRTVLDGLPDSKSPELHGAYAHALKSVAVGADHSLYVSVGSTANASAEDREADPERAAILRITPGASTATTFARGVRNGTGLAIAPDGGVWTAVNNRDNTAYPYRSAYDGGSGSDYGLVLQPYVNDHPLEPIARLRPGRDLGWPYCNPDPDVDPGTGGTAFSYTDRAFVRDVQTNADGRRLDCAALPAVEQGLPAHSAPLGLDFVAGGVLPAPYGAGALVGVHGSWNRTPPRAPEVAFLPWRNGTLGAPRTLLSGFQLGDGSRWGRPVAAVDGPDGAVYVTDDAAGAVYRMLPPA